MNGDVFAAVQFRERPHWPYALQLRLIEADQVCSPDRTDHLAPGKVNGKSVFQIVQGVETNEAGEIVAYWVANRHPLEYETRCRCSGSEWKHMTRRPGNRTFCVLHRESVPGSGAAFHCWLPHCPR
mgnify:CR=1 FL=1